MREVVLDVGYGQDVIIDTRVRASWNDRRGVRVPVEDVIIEKAEIV